MSDKKPKSGVIILVAVVALVLGVAAGFFIAKGSSAPSADLESQKIAETWISWDNVAFLSQLGLMPELREPVDTGTQDD